MIDDDLSEAVVVFIGKGRTRTPLPDKLRLAREMGDKRAALLLPQVRAIIAEMGEIKIDWTRMDLNAATDRGIALIRDLHPELSDAALDAVDWLYSWSNR